MRVVNFDEFGQYERRQHELGDIPLGKRGVPVRGGIYFACIAIVIGGLTIKTGVGGWLMSQGPATMLIGLPLVFVVVPGAIAFIATQQMPGGLPMHRVLEPAVRYFTESRDLFGWLPVGDLEKTWRPPDLVVEPDASDPSVPQFRLTGPADLLIANEYVRAPDPGLLQRFFRRGRADAELEISNVPADRPRGLRIPAGVTIEWSRK